MDGQDPTAGHRSQADAGAPFTVRWLAWGGTDDRIASRRRAACPRLLLRFLAAWVILPGWALVVGALASVPGWTVLLGAATAAVPACVTLALGFGGLRVPAPGGRAVRLRRPPCGGRASGPGRCACAERGSWEPR